MPKAITIYYSEYSEGWACRVADVTKPIDCAEAIDRLVECYEPEAGDYDAIRKAIDYVAGDDVTLIPRDSDQHLSLDNILEFSP